MSLPCGETGPQNLEHVCDRVDFAHHICDSLGMSHRQVHRDS